MKLGNIAQIRPANKSKVSDEALLLKSDCIVFAIELNSVVIIYDRIYA